MNQITLNDIKYVTNEFLDLHWPNSWQATRPSWNKPWYFLGSLPDNNKQGVYALLTENEFVLYIGVGASFGGGIYEGSGLGSRVNKYWKSIPNQTAIPIEQRKYQPVDVWKSRGLYSVVTIGFNPKQAYIAYALEAFLLSRFQTLYNKIRSARIKN